MSKINKTTKILKIIVISISGLIVTSVLVFYGLFFNETNALFSINKLENNIYKMHYGLNYYFDDFLDTGASNDEELWSFVVSKLLKGMPIDIELPNFACSSFSAVTSNGEHFFARNYDFDNCPIMINKTNPIKGYKSISTCDLSFLSYKYNDYLPDNIKNKFLCLAMPYIPIDGMNEKGVSISVNMLHGEPANQQTDKIDLTTTTLVRLVLDKAANCDEAVELISNYDLIDSAGSRFHYHIADKSGKSVVIEYYNNEMLVVENETNYFIATNFTLNDIEEADNFGRDRYDIINTYLTENQGIVSEINAMQLLEDAKMDWSGGGSQWSIIYNLDKLTAEYAFYTDYSKTYKYKL